jgi:sialate O-acetylesterase
MQWDVRTCRDGGKEIAEANYPNIRLLNIPTVAGPQPAANVNAKWAVCSPQTISNFSAAGYYFGRELNKELKVPIGLIANAWGGQPIEPFTPPAGISAIPELAGKPQRNPSIIYNGMVAPIVPYGIRGAIWYQGESNHGDNLLYFHRMRALIAGWRQVWGQGDFPFYYVQLAPYGQMYNGEELPLLWEAQRLAMQIPNTGMAVITDIGNVRDIHPANKQDVGRRLALWALAKTYGRDSLVHSGPLFREIKVEGDKVRVIFDHVGGGLKSRDGKPLAEFEIAGGDGKFVPAVATIDGQNVLVQADSVKEPKHVRLGWRREANPNLMNVEGLPASPFRSNAEAVTMEKGAAKSAITHKMLVFGNGRGAQIIDGDGKVMWKFGHPASDGHLLENGNVLMALYPSKNRYPKGALVEVDPSGKVVWEWRGRQQELVTALLLENGNVLTVELGQNPKLLELTRDGKVAVEVPLEAQKDNIHLQVRMARKLSNGNYIVPQLKEKEVREYAPDGKIVSRIPTPNWAFTAIRLDNGNTVVGCTIGNLVAELDPTGKVAWQAGNGDLGNLKLDDACGVQRLPNGNTVMTSYHAKKDQVKLVEVTPDKKVVWTFNDGAPHGIHHFQILDTNGEKLPGRPLR